MSKYTYPRCATAYMQTTDVPTAEPTFGLTEVQTANPCFAITDVHTADV